MREAVNKLALAEMFGVMVLSPFIEDDDLEILEECLYARSKLMKYKARKAERKAEKEKKKGRK